MTQSSMVIGNVEAPAARAALNTALEALTTLSSGATAPASTFSYMLWYDTATDILKMRNAADDAWITVGTINQGAATFAAAVILATQAQAEAGSNNTALMTPLRTAQAIAELGASAWTRTAEVATTSGTAFDTTSIPATATEVEFLLTEVALSGTDSLLFQIGDSGGVETADYEGFSVRDGALNLPSSAGFPVAMASSALAFTGILRLVKMDGNKWLSTHVGTSFGADRGIHGSGFKTLSATLDRVRLTRTGSNTFAAGSFSVRYR